MELLLKYLSWPAVVLILGVFGLLLFKKKVGSLIDRTRSVGKDGWVGESSSSAKEQAKATPEIPDRIPAPTKQPELPSVFSRRVEAIRQELRQQNLDLQTQVEVLIQRLAATDFFFASERIYNLIFGSQISLLKLVNTLGEMEWEQVVGFYQSIHDQYPVVYGNRTVDSYVDFLVRFGLLVRNAKGISITDDGREFLVWLVRTQKSELRAW